MEPQIVQLSGSYTLLRRAFLFYKKHLKQFVFIGFIPFLLSAAAVLLNSDLIAPSKDGILWVSVTAGVLGLLLSICNIAVQIILQSVFIKTFKEIDAGNPIHTNDAYYSCFKMFWPIFWVNLLTLVVIMGGSLLLIIPGIILSVFLSFTNFALIIDGERGYRALSTSFYYVRNHAWSVFRKLLFVTLIAFLVQVLVVGFAAGIYTLCGGEFTHSAIRAALDSGSLWALVFSLVAEFIFGCVVLPVLLAYFYQIYKELRTIKTAPKKEVDFVKSRKWFLGLSIWGFVSAVILVFLLIAMSIIFISAAVVEEYRAAELKSGVVR